ncbi:hypothetical protein HK101_003840 [Irineochytrium annulatum]|nr:hypothetical protein HK101_003840 [Irineochytrium annulatum]
MAGVTSVFFSYPLDILRTRLAFEVHGANSHVGLLSTAGIMYREKNPFGIPFLNFYRGFLPTIYGMIPYAGVSFLFYEKLKLWAFDQPYLLEHPLPAAKDSSAAREGKRKLKVWAHLGIGGLSGAIAQTASYPLEVIRRNMQIAGKASGAIASAAVRYPSTLETARLIYSRKGFRGFFVGLSIGYLKITPMSAVSFFVYEYMKGVLNIE